jgi:8-oxo-dGTP diphosphatase
MADLTDRQKHIIYCGAAIHKNGKILVGKRSLEESHEPGKWALQGGKVDQTKGGEKNILEKTVIREVKEETGLSIKSSKYLYSTSFIRSTGHHVVALIFLCPWKSGNPKPLEDTIELAWVGPKDLKLKNFDWAHGTLDSLKIAFKHLL